MDGHVLLRVDGGDADALYVVRWILQRNSPTLGHVQMYLAPA